MQGPMFLMSSPPGLVSIIHFLFLYFSDKFLCTLSRLTLEAENIFRMFFLLNAMEILRTMSQILENPRKSRGISFSAIS